MLDLELILPVTHAYTKDDRQKSESHGACDGRTCNKANIGVKREREMEKRERNVTF